MKTVPSCPEHNNGKSADDLYVLTQISINAGAGDNLPKAVFMRSVRGALKRSPKFRSTLNEGAEWLDGGARRYKVDIARCDRFFDDLCCAIFFDRYGSKLDLRQHTISHTYLSLKSDDLDRQSFTDNVRNITTSMFDAAGDRVTYTEAAKIDEVVYANRIIDPSGCRGSITIAHTFYGCFEVMSFLSITAPIFLIGQMPR